MYPYGASPVAQFQNLGSTYGSGSYMPYVPGLTGYGMAGFNNQYPNWNQGNMNQYYTGGTGSGLTNTGYTWYRSRQNIPLQGPPGNDFQGNPPMGMNPSIGPNAPVGFNPPRPMRKSAVISASRK